MDRVPSYLEISVDRNPLESSRQPFPPPSPVPLPLISPPFFCLISYRSSSARVISFC